MAQAMQDEKIEKQSDENVSISVKITNTSSSSCSNSNNCTSKKFKFNAQAPEFVPSSHSQATSAAISGYYYPYYNYPAIATDDTSPAAAATAADWMYYGSDQIQDQQFQYLHNPNFLFPKSFPNSNYDLHQKIIKQVEYQFSGLSLLSNESLMKQINKDPEGYVPISVIASTKKVKSLSANNQTIVQALRSSSMLLVSNDGKKVKRKYSFTDKEKEELQSRTVVVENLPDDHSHQNLEKIFNVVGSVKTIRICHPQESNSSRSKSDYVLSNKKLHALVEYENTETAERAVEKLNDERNWRKGLRVRLLLRLSPKSILRREKSDFDGYLEDEDDEAPQHESSEHANLSESLLDSNGEEISGGTSTKKGWGRGKGKGGGRPRVQSHNGRGLLAPSPQLSSLNINCEVGSAVAAGPGSAPALKQITKGPRMPDGTRGFTMGRGRPAILSTPFLCRMASY